ncbi:hydantoinase B/oxoprolinase family protein [Phytohabitans sp. ZYX-F-186]|uniref:Hydantoinase B/oxoprolinase family protein n=1 Tax=Phytohabitans maris TaxID=3071409 RepID=A0ABU0ZLU7_9ACTN|nr:hydantoinase B/oxoprolinase family protein [Phytohabitans sp. ZYX-F-186]MDQ7908026.1 hydantoinase B/oxoprolinase family protein [Phytohabitans sp. ZYX-F-186]
MGIETTVVDEVLANLFQAIVDDMAAMTLRSAYTTFVKETEDFGTGLITVDGDLVAYPGSLGAKTAMGVPLAAGVDPRYGWEEGDILITNDPYFTEGMVTHLNDMYVFKPVFAGGELVCFSWGFIHCTDVGGAVPGSITFHSHEIYQEGLRLRPVKLYKRGVLNEDVRHIFEDNCRIPVDNWGDISALIAAVNSGEKRVLGLVDKYGREAVTRAMSATIDTTERLARSALRRIPAGEYRFTEFFEDDYVSGVPVKIEVCLRTAGDGSVTLDFTGSDPKVRSALNLAAGGQPHHPFLCRAIINFVGTFAPGIRLNVGILRCVDLVLPPGSVVDAPEPSACGLRIGTVLKVHDAVLGCLAQALPESVPAAGAGQVVITYVSTSDLGRAGRVVVANPVQGGSGGGPAMDGVSGADRPVAFLKNVPVEVLEAEAPVRVRRFGLRPDSEGPGQFRGGFGIRFDVELTAPNATLVMRGQDRHVFNPWGVHGGHAGSNAGCFSTTGGEPVYLGKTNLHRPALGETISIFGAGGGGYGDPLDRDPARVLADHVNGFVCAERARECYGVVLVDEAVDEDATALLRDLMRAERGERGWVDLGAARRDWQERNGLASRLVTEWVWSLPPAVRTDAKVFAFQGLAKLGDGPYTEQDVRSVLASAGGLGASR